MEGEGGRGRRGRRASPNVSNIDICPSSPLPLSSPSTTRLVLFDLLSVLEFPVVAKFNKKPRTVKDKLKNINKALASFREAGCIIPEHVTPDQVRFGRVLFCFKIELRSPLLFPSSPPTSFQERVSCCCVGFIMGNHLSCTCSPNH